MTRPFAFMLAALLACRLGGAAVTAAAPPPTALSGDANVPAAPLGHPDFYPSDDRPVGRRGDGTGAWPGASVVPRWDAETGTNVVWKTAMPGPSFSQPIVVGDKVFTLADPNWLVCVSARDGKILWQAAADHTSVMSPEVAAEARAAAAFWDELFRQYSIWLDVERGFTPKLPKEEIDRAIRAGDDYGFDVNRPGQANFSMIAGDHPVWERWRRDQARYSVYAFGHWEGILTHTFATPVSDGRHVYVNMSNDQVACYDLDGNRRWLVWDRPAQAKATEHHVRYAMSPLLVGDRLIVAACGELRAYDKQTGRKLWGVFHAKDFGSRWVKVGTPVHMRLTFDGRPYDVLLSPGSGIYRLDDGVLVGELPDLPGYEGSTALTDGETYIRKDAPDGGPSVRLAGRFRVAADRVEFVPLWESAAKSKANNLTDVLFEGAIYSPANGLRIALADGASTPTAVATNQARHSAPILVGRTLVTIGSGSYSERAKRPGVLVATLIDLDNPAAATTVDPAFVDRRYLEDQEYRLRWRWRGNGDAVSNSSPVAQANRLFFRTAGYLWCVGDPRNPWPTPATAPASARISQ